MKKSIIAAVIVVAAAVAGVTAYEVATANNTETTVTADNVKPATGSTKSNATESSTTISSGIEKNVKSESRENTETNTAVANTSSKNQEEKSNTTTKTTSVSSNNNENTVTTSSTKTSETIKPTTSSSNNTESSRTSTKSSIASTGTTSNGSSTTSTGVTSDNSTSTNNMINGEPILFNSNSQVSSYYGTWTIGSKVGGAIIGNGESVTPPTGDNIIITKSLYSFDGTVIENPNYYIISTSASTYFGSAGWTGDIGATSNGVIKFIIAVPSDVKVTSSTIYRYEKENKIIINDGNLIVLDSGQTAYSASLE